MAPFEERFWRTCPPLRSDLGEHGPTPLGNPGPTPLRNPRPIRRAIWGGIWALILRINPTNLKQQISPRSKNSDFLATPKSEKQRFGTPLEVKNSKSALSVT